jgi:hypothetical protein
MGGEKGSVEISERRCGWVYRCKHKGMEGNGWGGEISGHA